MLKYSCRNYMAGRTVQLGQCKTASITGIMIMMALDDLTLNYSSIQFNSLCTMETKDKCLY